MLVTRQNWLKFAFVEHKFHFQMRLNVNATLYASTDSKTLELDELEVSATCIVPNTQLEPKVCCH